VWSLSALYQFIFWFFVVQDSMKTSFVDYYKLILDKVSFQQDLFAKEYGKAMKRLVDSEQDELNQWLRDRGLYREPLQQMSTVPGSITELTK
jgi:hypothetical protein